MQLSRYIHYRNKSWKHGRKDKRKGKEWNVSPPCWLWRKKKRFTHESLICTYHHIILPTWVEKNQCLTFMTHFRAAHCGNIPRHLLLSDPWAAPQMLQHFHLTMSTGWGIFSCPCLSSPCPADDQFHRSDWAHNSPEDNPIQTKEIHEAACKGVEGTAAGTNTTF